MKSVLTVSSGLCVAVVIAACGGGGNDASAGSGGGGSTALPQLSPAVGTTMTSTCASLTGFTHANTVITASTDVAAGTLTVGGNPIAAHCLVTGRMHDRVSAVDAQAYAIGFQMRMPIAWNGRYYYQGNGGTDGSVASATGVAGSGGPLSNALHKGFAVISSDAGHNGSQNPLFGMDPIARVDYGYGAVAKLTPMAKALIATAYGKGPDRSYIGGSSNGGRHAMVAAARFADQYDGVLANSPGFDLPLAAAAQLYSAQQFRRVATDETNLETAFTVPERTLVAQAILSRCDALDGVADGMVQDIEACRTAFDLNTHVPTCTGARDNTCLTEDQKDAIGKMYRGPVNSAGTALYTTQPFDPGLVTAGWASWKFSSSVGNARDPVAVGIIFQVPPDPTIAASTTNSRNFAFNYNFDTDFPKLFATDSTYTENAMSFMTPPNPTRLNTLRDRGAKLIVVQGASDGVFSIDSTKNWYDGLNAENGGRANAFARFYRVPGMNHSSGGPATEQYDALASLVDWVERGVAPDRIIATARGAGNAGGANAAVPGDWAVDRTRPLCPYPQVARYNGTGTSERAENFTCR